MTYVLQPGAPVPPAVPGAATQWMAPLPPIPNCPPGLEYLTLIDRIIVEERQNLRDMVFGALRSKYAVLNQNGQQVYYACDEPLDCEKVCSGPNPGFSTYMVDNFQKEVLKFFRPTKCSGWCFGPREVLIEAPPGKQIGTVRQTNSCSCDMDFWICGADGEPVLKIVGPNPCSTGCICTRFSDKIFKIETLKGEAIGEIRKKFTGYLMEMYTDIDNFTVNFPMDLDVNTKAVLIGATFMIDELYFTNDQAARRR